MLTQNKQKGFTLVELAIVLVIVGLLIGGILKGQQLMENASITATVSQIKAIEAATTSFLDAYGALPGDLLDASSKISGCDDDLCTSGTAAAASAKFNFGDGIVGYNDWNLVQYQPGLVANAENSVAAVAGGMETLLFWYSLQATGLINAVKTDALTNTNSAFGNTVPRAEIAGGFWVGYTNSSTGAAAIAGPAGTAPNDDAFNYSLLGTVLALVAEPATAISTGAHDANAVVPSVAGSIDRKVDDGNPQTGYVQALGHNDCAASGLYNESNEQLDCGVYINIVPQN